MTKRYVFLFLFFFCNVRCWTWCQDPLKDLHVKKRAVWNITHNFPSFIRNAKVQTSIITFEGYRINAEKGEGRGEGVYPKDILIPIANVDDYVAYTPAEVIDQEVGFSSGGWRVARRCRRRRWFEIRGGGGGKEGEGRGRRGSKPSSPAVLSQKG